MPKVNKNKNNITNKIKNYIKQSLNVTVTVNIHNKSNGGRSNKKKR
jgi:hypothetical protein